MLSPNAIRQLDRLFVRVRDLEREVRALRRDAQTRSQPFLLGKPDANIAKGGTGQVNIWSGTKGSETVTNLSLASVFCRTQAVTTSDFVYVYWVQGAVPGWECNLAEC